MKIQYRDQYLTVFESAIYRTTSSVIQLKDNIIIIDPNWLPIEIEFISAFCDANYNGFQIYLLFTHSDYDHIIGYHKFPKAKVIASHNFVSQPLKKNILNQIYEFDHEYYIKRTYPIAYPDVDIVIRMDGQKISIGDDEIIFYHAIGHNSDGLVAVFPNLNLMIAGDYLSNIEIPMIDYNYQEYVHTLERFKKIAIQFPDLDKLITGHGDITHSNNEILHRIRNDQNYLSMLKMWNEDPNELLEEKIRELIKNYADNPNLYKIHQRNLSKF